MADSYSDLCRLIRFLCSRRLNNSIVFDDPIRSRDAKRFPDTL
jgi:hypothetical protein